MREPAFWWRKPGPPPALLAPFAAIYGAVAARRMAKAGARAGVQVVCIGNPTVGGAGKTPTAIAVARLLAAAGEQPVLLTPRLWRAARRARCRSIRDSTTPPRSATSRCCLRASRPPSLRATGLPGAAAAVAAGADVIVMDDGFQNPSLAKDFSVLVVDGRRGIGNGAVIPAGPLRAPLAAQLDRADALVVVGETGTAALPAGIGTAGMPVFRARLVPDGSCVAALGAAAGARLRRHRRS